MNETHVNYEPTPAAPSKAALWTGRVIGGLPAVMLLAMGMTDVLKSDFAVKGLVEAGYPERVAVPLGVATVVCAVLYLVPRTAVLGAVLITGYLGGAVATHTRQGDPPVMLLPAVLFAALVWVGLLLREPRLRGLLPLRR